MCSWRFENGDYCAYLIDFPTVVGFGESVRLAVDDLYLSLPEDLFSGNLTIDVVEDPSNRDRLFKIEPSELSEATGKASRFYLNGKCLHCGKFSHRNYSTPLDLKSKPKHALSYVRRRGIRVYSAPLCEELSKFGLEFSRHRVTIEGLEADFFELEPKAVFQIPLPKRGELERNCSWSCRACGYTVYLIRDIPTGLPSTSYVLENDIANIHAGFFITDGSSAPFIVLRGWVIDVLKERKLFKGLGVSEVFAIQDNDASSSFCLPDFPPPKNI